jgi:hypothetical protein
MIDYETFLTELYVMADDFCKYNLPLKRKPGPQTGLSLGEVVTLAIAGQWFWYGSERAFYTHLKTNWSRAFPQLPTRTQLNRQMRQEEEAITRFALFVSEQNSREVPYEVIDGSAVPTRDINRRGNGWLPDIAQYGKSNRLGFYEGVHLLISVTPIGSITGFGFGSANVKDSTLAETFLAARAQPQARLISVGKPALGDYLADKGFSQDNVLQRWRRLYQANVITAPKNNSRKRRWPKSLRRWLAGRRQIVETVFQKLHNVFRLDRERPHDLTGLQMRLAAKVALHNFCIYLNLKLGRSPLAFANLITR